MTYQTEYTVYTLFTWFRLSQSVYISFTWITSNLSDTECCVSVQWQKALRPVWVAQWNDQAIVKRWILTVRPDQQNALTWAEMRSVSNFHENLCGFVDALKALLLKKQLNRWEKLLNSHSLCSAVMAGKLCSFQLSRGSVLILGHSLMWIHIYLTLGVLTNPYYTLSHERSLFNCYLLNDFSLLTTKLNVPVKNWLPEMEMDCPYWISAEPTAAG